MRKTSNLQDYMQVSKYSRTKADNTKETWEEAVARVMGMHSSAKDVFKIIPSHASLSWDMYNSQKIVGAQRALQYGGEQLLKHNMRMYNCSGSLLNRTNFFNQLFYILLCGAGAGYRLHKEYVEMMPKIQQPLSGGDTFDIPDCIEGWADSILHLMEAYFYAKPLPKFNYELIRREGSYISGGFSAPGPDPLRKCLTKVSDILKVAVGRHLTTFECHRISCIIGDAVISGGIRRSALISMFELDDTEMLTCKTGNWWAKYPELARANNSVVINPDEVDYKQFEEIFEYIKQYGEPGIIFSKHKDMVVNPCCEVGMYPIIKDAHGNDRYGWSLCNLTEIPITNINDEDEFYKACEAASTLGTIQATYTDFPYLIESDGFNPSEKIVRRDALIGVGLTGMYDNPRLSFNEEIQRKGAQVVKDTNRKVAKELGINFGARTTVIKPSGNGSQLLGTASGIHPRHAKNYIRHIQANNNEQALKEYKRFNPDSVMASIYNPAGESVIGFAVSAPETAIVRKDLSTKEFIENVVRTQTNWIKEGTNLDHPFYIEHPEMVDMTHNVSNTITVRTGEWDIAKDTIWENRDNLCGISMLSEVELDYNQMPFTEVLMPEELVDIYGAPAILSSGLVVDGLDVFDNDLWAACDTAITQHNGTPRAYARDIEVSKDKVLQAISDRLNDGLEYNASYNGSGVKKVEDIVHVMQFKHEQQVDWIRRFVKFANRYFNGDLVECMNCLKHVSLFHKWCKLKEATPINWSSVRWENILVRAGSDTAQGCSGGKCEI